MILVEARERFTKVEFQADQDWQTYPRADYVCPVCQKAVALALTDLDRHRVGAPGAGFTNLTATDSARIDQVVAGSGRSYNAFLDFYCPGCHHPVRVYYTAWAGGRYTHGHVLEFVVENSAA